MNKGLIRWTVISLLVIAILTPSACKAPAEFEVSSLVIRPAEVVVGEVVTVKADVANVGGVEGSHTVTLLVDGTEVERKGITLAPGSMQTVSFELVRDVAGAYKVQIDGVSEPLVVREIGPEKLGEIKYDIEHETTLKNEGLGVVSRLVLAVTLITTREPYQTVVSTNINPDNCKTTEDEYGNTFAEFEFSDIGAREEISVKITYQVAVSQLGYQLGPSEGPVPARFLEPETWIESNAGEIVALAKQLTKDKINPCEKARAIYDWIGDNISYTGPCDESRGALFGLRNRGGDCTEFSDLLIALCRAAGIPACSLYGVNPERPSPAAGKHSWAEIYLAGTGWVPVDPTWGRFKERRAQYFASMTADHIIVGRGRNIEFLDGLGCAAFCWRWWCKGEETKVSGIQSWQIYRHS